MTAAQLHKLPVQDIIEWDVYNWSQLIRYWQPVLETLPRNSKVLAVGERNGGLALWLALLGFDVLCTDMREPTEQAMQLHKQYNVAHKIQYRSFDLVQDDLGSEQFDIIIAKSVIGGLKAQRSKSSTRSLAVQKEAIDHIHRLLKPGGYFFSAENLKGGALIRWVRKVRKKEKGWRHIDYRELQELFKSYALVQTKTFGILPTFFSQKGYNYCMYFINRYVLCFMPPSAKYIAFTIAQK